MKTKTSLLSGAAVLLVLSFSVGAQAETKPVHHRHAKVAKVAAKVDETQAEIQELKAEVQALQSRLDAQGQAQQQTDTRVQAAQQQAAAAEAQAATAQNQVRVAQAQAQDEIKTIPTQVQTAVAAGLPKPGNVKVTLGGFAAMESVYRSRQDVADIGSNYSKIPYDNSALAHEDEFRGSARQSRLSVLVQGDASDTVHAAFYGEFDFLGAAQTANSNESNSYNPRIRHVYGTVDWDSMGLHLLAGQNWSLATMNGKGITPRNEVIPTTIEAQYVVGFVWARQPQVRIVKDFDDHQAWIAFSAENPQTTFAGGLTGVGSTASGISANTSNAGISLLANVNNFSYNNAPDLIGKLAFEPKIGGAQPLHMEVFGIWREYYDRVTYATGNALGVAPGISNVETTGGGVGGGVTWTVVPKVLDVQASFLTGTGVGRYGSGQLPDTIVAVDGSLKPIPETMFMAGGTLHATPLLDIYAYYGQERENRAGGTKIGSTFFGYGNPNATLGGCLTEGGTCSPDTQQVSQYTAGIWDRLYNGKFGSVRFGLQYSHTDLTAFAGLNGATFITPKTNDDMIFTSFRYYPAF